MHDHPLRSLEGRLLKEYRLHLQRLKQLRLTGWRGFSVALEDRDGKLAQPPVVEGIYSAGGKDDVQPWMDITVSEVIAFGSGKRLNLRQAGLIEELFQSLSLLIPPGGHLMVSYEDTDPLHRETDRALAAGVPPVMTPLGFLLFRSGFRLVKNWYLSEGGHEGPRKLWGEKPPDNAWALVWDEDTARQLVSFLKKWKKPSKDQVKDRTWIEGWRKIARMIFSALKIEDSNLLQQGKNVLQVKR
jgi:hypothetical protein